MGDHDRNLENYSKAIRRNSDLARVELKKIFDRFKNASAEDMRDAVFLAMPGLVERFGEISVNAALEYYGEERSLITSSHYRPFRGIRVSKREIERTIRFHAGKLFEGDTAGFTSALFDELDRWVLESGRRALIATSERDKACTGWARIPSGSKTCAFCYMLASRGFAYKSADSAGHETKFHTKCDCRVVPEFDGKTPKYQGYDPESMHEVYKAAHKKGDSASDVLQRMRRRNPDLFTDGVGGGGGGGGKPPKFNVPDPEEPDRYKKFERDGKLAPSSDRYRYFSEEEKISAEILEADGASLVSIDSYKKSKAPDAYDEVSGRFIEFKTPERFSLRGIKAHLSKAAQQAPHVFVRFSEIPPSELQVEAFFKSEMESFKNKLKSVIVEVEGGKRLEWNSE